MSSLVVDGQGNRALPQRRSTLPPAAVRGVGRCALNCPTGFFTDRVRRECLPCHRGCLTCVGPRDADCTSCRTHPCMDQKTCPASVRPLFVPADSQLPAVSVADGRGRASRALLPSLEVGSCLSSCPAGTFSVGGRCRSAP